MEGIKERQKQAYQNMFYSIQRMDLLIISICGAGIYTCLETVKFIIEQKIVLNPIIKFSGGFFILSIIVNFISQWFGFKTNEQDYLMCEAEINSGKTISKSEKSLINSYDRKSDCYTELTNTMNIISMILMAIGLILISIFFFVTF